MIIMEFNYYACLVIGMIAETPAFVEFAESTCPTYWIDGSICSPVDDLINKASMETELLIALIDETIDLRIYREIAG